jgi:diguanylate cyclase (GGDEF)-like protein
MAQAKRSEELCAVVLLDIDNFKAVNDTYGHDAGDRVLVGVAERMDDSTRASDVLARLGGEEFCKLLIAPKATSLGKIAMDILTSIGEDPFDIAEGEIPVTISMGIAYGEGCTLDQLIEAADTLLYQAKNSGRNRAVIAPIDGSKPPHIVEGPPGIEKPYLKDKPVSVQDWR